VYPGRTGGRRRLSILMINGGIYAYVNKTEDVDMANADTTMARQAPAAIVAETCAKEAVKSVASEAVEAVKNLGC